MAAIVVGSGGNNGEIWQDITDQLTWKTGKSLYSAQSTGSGRAISYVMVGPYTLGHYDIIAVAQGEKYRITGWINKYSDIVGSGRLADATAFSYAMLDSNQRTLALPHGLNYEIQDLGYDVPFYPPAVIVTDEIMIPASVSYLFLANLAKYFENLVSGYHASYPSTIPSLSYSLDDFRLEKLVQ